MTETRTTVTFGAAALLLALIAWATTPRARTPDVFMDRGQLFFPEFTDPNAATSLEVIEFQEQNAAARPFKVLNRNGRWTVPSHHDYPADGQERLAQTAAAVIALRKSDFASENAADLERCGVLDPLDETLPNLKGRGTRVTIRGENDRLLADIIIGGQVEGREDFRYVRLPGQKRVYVSRVGDLTISTNFADWIERDLLQVERPQIDEVVISDYSFDQSTGDQTLRDTLLLQKKGDDDWALRGSGQAIDIVPVNQLISTLDRLTIVGVLRKPPGITATLTRSGAGTKLVQSDLMDLASKGFYLTREGQLLSNEGEVVVHTTDGIFYTLRFGQVATGLPEASAAPSPAPTDRRTTPGENRYLFVTVGFDPSTARPPGRSPEPAEQRTALLRARFAPWYYVISADNFSKIRLQRSDLFKKRRT